MGASLVSEGQTISFSPKKEDSQKQKEGRRKIREREEVWDKSSLISKLSHMVHLKLCS